MEVQPTTITRYRRPLAVVFAVLLLIWSWLLVRRNEIPESFLGGYSWFDREMFLFYLSKCVHLSGYAFFAILGGILPTTPRGRLLLWLGLGVHGIASEIGQMIGNAYFQTNRHGCIRDMLIDAAGVSLGAIAVLAWNRSGSSFTRLLARGHSCTTVQQVPNESCRNEVHPVPSPECFDRS